MSPCRSVVAIAATGGADQVEERMTTAISWQEMAPDPPALAAGQRWHVFLSYRSVNRPWVVHLYDVLRGHGYEVFLDQVVLVPGDQLLATLGENLRASASGVLVWSSSSADSVWVQAEYEAMFQQKAKGAFRFVPLRVDNTVLPGFVDTAVFLDFSSYPDGPNGGELLRLLHALAGMPLSAEAVHFATEQDQAAQQASNAIAAAVDVGNAKRLIELYESGGIPWETSAALGCNAANGLLRLGNVDPALTMLRSLCDRFPRSIRPRQLLGLALARRGEEEDLQEAQTTLAELYAAGERDPETLGIYARTWMDRYQRSGDSNHLRKSRDLYALAFLAAQDDYYTGINAAAKSALLGEVDTAAEQAAQVATLVGTDCVPDDYWMSATVAEVQLLQGNWAAAAMRYMPTPLLLRRRNTARTSPPQR